MPVFADAAATKRAPFAILRRSSVRADTRYGHTADDLVTCCAKCSDATAQGCTRGHDVIHQHHACALRAGPRCKRMRNVFAAPALATLCLLLSVAQPTQAAGIDRAPRQPRKFPRQQSRLIVAALRET